MQKHRVAQISIATLLGLGSLLFAKIYLVDGWGHLRPNAYVVMSCAVALMVIGSAGLYMRNNWGRVASLAFFYLCLVFTLPGGVSVGTLVRVAFVLAFLIALHAMKPGSGTPESGTNAPVPAED